MQIMKLLFKRRKHSLRESNANSVFFGCIILLMQRNSAEILHYARTREKVKVRLMYEICMCKFMQNPELRDKLLATGESTLIEGNNWGDYFWGKVNNCGENQLGIILMDVRAKLQWNAETAPNNIPQCLQ